MTYISELKNLKGRRAIITGASGGLGLVIAETLAELGSDLILVDRPNSDLSKIEKHITEVWDVNVNNYECDLELEKDRIQLGEEIIEENRELNCLINCAAFTGDNNLQGWSEKFEDQSIDTWRRALEVTLAATFHLCLIFTPSLQASVGGNILNITSIYGRYGPDWNLYEGTKMGNPAAYAASKGGLNQLTRWLSSTLAPNIRVNAIAPGGIFRNQEKNFVERYNSKTPMNRMATEDDFRGAVAFLASDMSSYVTGQILYVDGGWGVW